MSDKIEFETFKSIGFYEIENLTKNQPTAGNFLSYKKFKVTVEPIEESNDIYISRLEELLRVGNGYKRKLRLETEILKLRQNETNKYKTTI